jgi:hypothetical protein
MCLARYTYARIYCGEGHARFFVTARRLCAVAHLDLE